MVVRALMAVPGWQRIFPRVAERLRVFALRHAANLHAASGVLHACALANAPGLAQPVAPRHKRHRLCGRRTERPRRRCSGGSGVVTASAEERIRQLTQRMLRKKLYVILSKGGATAEQLGAALPQHLEYMIGLEKTGVLFASGPLSAPAGAPARRRPDHRARRERRRSAQDRVGRPVRRQQLRTFEVRDGP